MSAVTASLCSTLMFVLFVSADQKTITAESGQDVTLTCRAPNDKIIVVKWSRADLGSEYVLLYQDGYFDPSNQHPSFKNRVDLQDRQMKDGDVSLILKHVTINDAGTYVCHVVQKVGGPMTLINSIDLTVVDPLDLSDGAIAGIIIAVIISVAVVVVGVWYYCRQKVPPADMLLEEEFEYVLALLKKTS